MDKILIRLATACYVWSILHRDKLRKRGVFKETWTLRLATKLGRWFDKRRVRRWKRGRL